ncbi:hypothetical protein Poli38472_004888 [Pythium oligandrum]|uniref:Uncharacterized protein n=1 Tax=Pythium oligandrum TaxID=41045 RepID=A0A8K1FGA8_PYTOL|nr:hypothetical protein Poli38472_004888 [Pythium oligandrum]|eukprot:TMW59819.1 hypothetical protein Poli38472_004888 [Pythium oligandrum]
MTSDVTPHELGEELETLLGGEGSAQATLEAALAFVDEFQSQEEWGSAQTTESSSSSQIDSPPAAKESSEEETPKPTKKPRVRKPDRTREELLYLRETVGELEKKVSELKDTERKHTERLETNSAWAKFASRQRTERERSEAENARLRSMYEEQIRLGKTLDRMFQKRGYMELLGADLANQSVKRVRGQPGSGLTVHELEEDLNRTVRAMYEQVDAISSTHHFTHQDTATPKRVVELLSDDATGTKVRTVDSRVLPFDYVETADAIWEFVMDRVHYNATCRFQRNEQSVSTKISSGRMGWLGTTDQFRVITVAQRHVEPDRVVIVSCMLLEPCQLGGTSLDGIWMRMCAWHIIQPGPNDSPDRPAALKHTFFEATPEVYGRFDEFSAGEWEPESGVGALTDFILHAVDGQMELNNQRVENHLADQLLRLQIQDSTPSRSLDK